MNSNNNHCPQARELAVYTVLGGGIVEKLRRGGAGSSGLRWGRWMEVLLVGAERLMGV